MEKEKQALSIKKRKKKKNIKKKNRPAVRPGKKASGNLNGKTKKNTKKRNRSSSSTVVKQKKMKHSGKKRKSLHKKRNPAKRKKKQRLLKELVVAVSLALLFFSIVFIMTVRIPKIEGYSMTPTINDQDRLFVYKWSGFKRFSLIYFEEPEKGEPVIRRIVGLPGEDLYYENGSLFVNGEEIPERFLTASSSESEEIESMEDFKLSDVTKVSKIPEDSYFVLGDNRSYATDSRYFGFVKKEDIIGVVKARIFPIHAMRQF